MKIIIKDRKKIIFLITLIILIIFPLLTVTENKVSPSDKSVSPTPDEKIVTDGEIPEEGLSNTAPILGADTVRINPERTTARVVGVRDGDTIEVDFGGGNVKTVRYIGIDTPETVDPRKSVECFGKEASNINKSLVEGQTVQLEKDISETDKYGRLLRYVFVGNIFVNNYLVEEGFAHSSAYPPDIKYQEDFDASEEEARLNYKGLWANCHPELGSGSSAIDSRLRGNDSLGDKDCSDFATHKEAQDYFVSKGGSSTNNVDKLDGSDHDGLVCETLP